MTFTSTQVLVAVGILLGWILLWRVSSWKRRRTLEASRSGARLLSLFGRVVFMAGLIVGVQWVVIVTAPDNHGLLLAVLGIPALFAAHGLTRALTVVAVDGSRVRSGRR
ncbi:hypothetical protein FHX82_001840 [Amycolatopsis bartoniae]|uniref:Uncharacterized protein n=1 Tax=Amycolatopsis bartoniae TaxID=941986 RepID=A0A8H9IT82_9PSEU|nr:hypothetical protein [Amycolatopsis bartoniae]MBB2934820.1 hypothetical protein [Amycolatopsis bartoniae]TVT03064.1 hypothetical protein FNH07_26110 [Amycolatopsis bartoniae]GHF44537.1 hypothetical protein GCM10017566_16840 [Amycolatopsis bartoniae]